MHAREGKGGWPSIQSPKGGAHAWEGETFVRDAFEHGAGVGGQARKPSSWLHCPILGPLRTPLSSVPSCPILGSCPLTVGGRGPMERHTRNARDEVSSVRGEGTPMGGGGRGHKGDGGGHS